MDERQRRQEERIAHLIRAVEDLSDVVRAQGLELARLERRVQALVERELDREAGAPPADQRPPHW